MVQNMKKDFQPLGGGQKIFNDYLNDLFGLV